MRQLRIPVGVLVERRAVASPWVDVAWRPVAVLAGVPDAAPWTPVSGGAKAVVYYAGAAEIELHRSEVDNYRRNLESEVPGLWVALHATGREPPYTIAVVTADPAEGEALTEPGQAIVETVAMPDAVREAVAAFVAAHPGTTIFVKRTLDESEFAALGHSASRAGDGDEE